MRVSEAALAIITRSGPSGETEFLTQWNERWQAYSLIGGHVKPGETFRVCCLREIAEELGCEHHDAQVSPLPYATLQFREYSQSAREETDYTWQLFITRLTDAFLQRLPTSCAWIPADQIRKPQGRAPDGKPIAQQVRRAFKAIDEAEFDLFVSYGHDDNQDGSVTALVEHIRLEHERFVPTEPLKIFFDVWGIHNGDEWERRISKGLIESKSMLAVLSPNYFQSQWCRREYDLFVQQQMKKLYPGEPIHAIYICSHPDFDATHDHPQRDWFEDLKRRQFLDAKPWWPDGQQALQRDVVVNRLNELRQSIWDRVCDARAVERSPSNLTAFNINFVGRERELEELWNALRLDHAVAVSAIQGVGGLGKTALARAYAHTRRREYPGGQFEIGMENINSPSGLKLEIVRLANLYLGAGIPDEFINQNLPQAFATAKAAFEKPGRGKILLILDNVAHEGVLSSRMTSLPSPEHVHVLATTRLDPEQWGLNVLRLESRCTADALDLFLKYRPFEIPTDAEHWHRVRSDYESVSETEVDSDEWKAAVSIVNRLGGHALAIEVVAIYLGRHRSIRLQDFLNGLIHKGLSVKLEQAGDDPTVRAQLRDAIETNLSQLLEPTFARLEQEIPLAMRALEWAALMPPDHIPWIWLRELIERDQPGAFQHEPDDPDPWNDGVARQLLGWRLLTSPAGQANARMHRIVQLVVAGRRAAASNKQGDPGNANDQSRSPDRLLNFLIDRAESLGHHWGMPGINWELTPLFEAALLLLDTLGVEVGVLIDRLFRPLQLDGRLLPAMKVQLRVITLEEARVEGNPERADYARDLSVSYSKMGDLFRALGNSLQARQYYEKDLEVAERLAASAPENVDHARDLSVSYIRMGDLFRALGNGLQAREYYEQSLEVIARLAANAPENADYARDLSVSCERMGDLFRELDNGLQAREYYEQSLAVRERLAASAPENAEYARDLWVSYWRMATVEDDAGLPDAALTSWRRAHEILQGMCDRGWHVSPEDLEFLQKLKAKLERQ